MGLASSLCPMGMSRHSRAFPRSARRTEHLRDARNSKYQPPWLQYRPSEWSGAQHTLTNPPPCLQFFTFDRNGLVRAETPPIPRHAGAAVQHKSEKNLYEPERFRERSVDPGSSTSDTPICTPCPFSFPPPIFFRS